MKTNKELIAEYTEWKQALTKAKNEKVYTATGLYHTDELGERAFNYIIRDIQEEYTRECASKLKDIAIATGSPLALWCVNNLPSHQAVYVIKHLPLYLDEMDALAAKTKWCDNVYQEHRANAIKSGALVERPSSVNK